ncbi:MAG: cytidine deaminase [Candidatus Marinimicrobia bacterium]|nr:cytidine deaminase [Candidatus Neomarinimicrobiota bacterium]
MKTIEQLLINKATDARKNSYSPYSKFKVGAALLGESGNVYVGTNVESSSYGLTVCAERNAIGAGIVAGETKFKSLVIISKDGVSPCGACRQVIYDVCGNIDVILVNEKNKIVNTLKAIELLPFPFDETKLKK